MLQVKIILKMCKLSNIIKMFGEKSASYVLLYNLKFFSLTINFDRKLSLTGFLFSLAVTNEKPLKSFQNLYKNICCFIRAFYSLSTTFTSNTVCLKLNTMFSTLLGS